MQIDIHPPREPRVLASQHRRTVADRYRGHILESNLRAALGEHGEIAQLLDRIANLPRIAQVDREALQAFDRLADVVAADRR